MNVFIVVGHIEYEDSYNIEVFASKDKAEEFLKKLREDMANYQSDSGKYDPPEYTADEYGIEEWEVTE